MPEIIKEIYANHKRDVPQNWDGYVVKTNKQEIEIGCSNLSHCCENWGCIVSDDSLECFIGMHLLNISVVDEKLDTVEVPNLYEGGAMFININTAIGVLQFAVYNQQNGSYGHTAFVRCSQLNYEEQI